MGIHARLGPSNHRWPNCPGSIREENAYPDISSDPAISGTGSHSVLEKCIIDKISAISLVGTLIGKGHEDKPEGWIVDSNRAARVQVCLDYIKCREEELGWVKVESESISSPGAFFGRNDWWGTVDVTLSSIDKSVIEIIDYKDGFVYVDVKNNSQLESYALGKLIPLVQCIIKKDKFHHSYSPVKTIRLTIVQPKTSKPVRYVDYTPDQLWKRGLILKNAATKTDQFDAPLCPGDWCRWCKHASNCKAKNLKSMEGFAMLEYKLGSDSLVNMDISSIENMAAEDLAKILDARESLKKVMKVITAVEVETLKRLEDGQSIPRYTKGSSNKAQAWKDDVDLIVKKLKGMRFTLKDIYPAKFITPAQALKKEDLTPRQRDRMIAELIDIKDGKPKIIPMKVNTVSAEEMFAEVVDPSADIEPSAPVDPTNDNFL